MVEMATPNGFTRAMATALLVLLPSLWLGAGCVRGCGQPEGTTSYRFDEAEVKTLFFGFRGAAPDAGLPPNQAFAAKALCPRITRARFKAGADQMGILQLWGENLERAQLIAGVSDGQLGEAPPHRESDGSVRFALGCRTCEGVLGFQLEGVKVGCRGPGYSVRLVDGVLVSSE